MVTIYIILVYDIGVERIDKVRKYLRRYLQWVQNSVFEGELTESEMMKIKNKLTELINKEEDSIRIYSMWDEKYIDIEELGTSKKDTDKII